MKMLQQVIIACAIEGHGHSRSRKEKGRLEKPRMTKKFIYLGFIEDWLVGMIAATLLVLSSNPESSLHLIILSIISGYGGEQFCEASIL